MEALDNLKGQILELEDSGDEAPQDGFFSINFLFIVQIGNLGSAGQTVLSCDPVGSSQKEAAKKTKYIVSVMLSPY